MRTTILAAALAAAITLSLQATAGADALGVEDPADLQHGVDLRAVVVDHGARKVVVTTTHANLRPSFRTGAGGAVYLDTDEADRGPEFVFVAGYHDGTDYSLLHTEGFHHSTWGMPVEGSYRMGLDYDLDHVRMRVSREALGSPGQVRVAVKVSGSRRDGTSVGVDWLGEPRSFTGWVTR